MPARPRAWSFSSRHSPKSLVVLLIRSDVVHRAGPWRQPWRGKFCSDVGKILEAPRIICRTKRSDLRWHCVHYGRKGSIGPPMSPVEPDAPHIDAQSARKISFVSLGCPKALVDSERIVTRLRAEGYELARAHDGADLVIVNTCGFLDSAQAESLDAIGAALRENGKVIVTGCMGAEPEKITATHPNVLAVTGPQQYESVLTAVHEAAPPG